MSYVYLLELHKLIDFRIEKVARLIDDSEGNLEQMQFHKGRMAVLSEFKDFLTLNLNPKLPRRLRKIHSEKK